MSEISIRRKARRQRFTVLDNALIEDKALTFEALGVLAYLLSKPDDWTVMVGDLQRRGGIGRLALRSIMGTLKAAGYAELRTVRTATGVAGTCWEVSEESVLRGRFPDGQVSRPSGDVTVRKPTPLVKTDFLPKTETSPSTDYNAAAGAPAAPSAAQDGGGMDEALVVACVQAMTGREGDDLASYGPGTVNEARAAARAIVQAWPDVTPEDIQAAASAWMARLSRAKKGADVDPPRGSQLVEALGNWSPGRTASAAKRRALIPAVER